MNKDIINNYCPNYDEIVEYDFNADDIISKKLIDYYREYITSFDKKDEKEIEKITFYDKAMHDYISDIKFFKKVQCYFNDPACNYGVDMVTNMIEIKNNYIDETLKDLKTTKWI